MKNISTRTTISAAIIAISAAAHSASFDNIQTYWPDKDIPCLLIENADGIFLSVPRLEIDYTMAEDGSYIMNFNDSSHNSFRPGRRITNPIPVNDITDIRLYYPYTEVITETCCDNEEWDHIYTTPRGYFATRSGNYDNGNRDYDEIKYLSFDGYGVSMLFDTDTGLPLSLTSDDIRLLFHSTPHFLSDVDDDGHLIETECDFICEVNAVIDVITADIPRETPLYTSENPVCIIIPKAGHPDNLHEYIYIVGDYDISPDNPLAPELFAMAACLSWTHINNTDYPLLSDLESAFREISMMKTYKSCGEVPDTTPSGIGIAMGAPASDSGGTTTISNVVAMTQESKNITDTKATLIGSIRCHSSRFRTEGTYGILVDTDESKLIKGEAKYDFPGTQGKLKLSFDVQASGLDPNTDYYYRAYYKLNSAKSDLSIKFDNRDPNKISDKTPTETYGQIKTFTTLPPDISGVWYFVNHVFGDNLYFDLKFDPHTGTYKAHDFYGVFSLEVKVNRDRSVTLDFTSHVSGAGFSGYFNEDYSAAKGSGTSTYMSDPTPFNMTR